MDIPEPSLRLLLLHEDTNEVSQSLAHDEASTPTPTFDWLGRPAAPHLQRVGEKKTLFFIAGTICLWLTAYFGIFFNLVLLFRNVLGEGSGAAASDTNIWLGSMFLSSLLGAFIAESFLGRLWACALFQSVAVMVLVAAARKWRVPLPTDSSFLYEECQEGRQLAMHTDTLRWLDKAATTTPFDKDGVSTRNRWKLSTVTEVEEMKAVLRLFPIWASSIFFSTIYSQAGTLLVEEGVVMNTSIVGSLTMEPATMNLFNILVVVLVAPLYDATVVPLARRITGLPRGLSPLHRAGLGYIISIIAVSLAALLEAYRLHCSRRGLAPPSIFWQVPEFVLLGFAEFLAGIGQAEFFYTHAPPSLRSLGSSFCLTCIALGDFASSLLVWVVTLASTRGGRAGWIPRDLDDGHLDYFFWLLGGLAFLNFLFFTASAISFVHQQSSAGVGEGTNSNLPSHA